jgi:hypothetical protein
MEYTIYHETSHAVAALLGRRDIGTIMMSLSAMAVARASRRVEI